MNRAQFLKELESELKRRGVDEIEDVLDEYSEHFFCKMENGCTEGEVAARLGSPKAIAAQYAGRETGPAGSRVGQVFAGIGVSLGTIIAGALEIVLAAFGLCCAAAGVQLLLNQNWFGLLPGMPRASQLILGAALLALAVVAALACAWLGRMTVGCIRACRAKPQGRAAHIPAGSARPIAIAGVIFLTLLAAGFAVSAILAGSIEFWHTWNWFGGI